MNVGYLAKTWLKNDYKWVVFDFYPSCNLPESKTAGTGIGTGSKYIHIKY